MPRKSEELRDRPQLQFIGKGDQSKWQAGGSVHIFVDDKPQAGLNPYPEDAFRCLPCWASLLGAPWLASMCYHSCTWSPFLQTGEQFMNQHQWMSGGLFADKPLPGASFLDIFSLDFSQLKISCFWDCGTMTADCHVIFACRRVSSGWSITMTAETFVICFLCTSTVSPFGMGH